MFHNLEELRNFELEFLAEVLQEEAELAVLLLLISGVVGFHVGVMHVQLLAKKLF